MSYSGKMQKNHLYTVLLAPRGNPRMADAGMQIAQMYLSPFDLLIGVMGEAGSGKSMLIKGMFPGLELTNDDEGVNVRPLPLMSLDDTGFFSPHTYHLDIRFEQGFYQLHELAAAITEAISRGKRVIVEHFDLIYPHLNRRNADLLIGVGEELIVTRPSVFGPEPEAITTIVFKSIETRKMSHTAEDLCEFCLLDERVVQFSHSDVRHGFILSFNQKPTFKIRELEFKVKALIQQDLPISYLDDTHILIGDQRHYCTGPRMHVDSAGRIKNFKLYPEFIRDGVSNQYQMVGLVGMQVDPDLSNINTVML